MNMDYLEKELNEQLGHIGECKVECIEDGYTLKVTLTLPPFVPALDGDTGELWYVCTRKGVNLEYAIRDDKYIVRGDKELMDLLFNEDEIYG